MLMSCCFNRKCIRLSKHWCSFRKPNNWNTEWDLFFLFFGGVISRTRKWIISFPAVGAVLTFQVWENLLIEIIMLMNEAFILPLRSHAGACILLKYTHKKKHWFAGYYIKKYTGVKKYCKSIIKHYTEYFFLNTPLLRVLTHSVPL